MNKNAAEVAEAPINQEPMDEKADQEEIPEKKNNDE
jgi:hypothetical protein